MFSGCQTSPLVFGLATISLNLSSDNLLGKETDPTQLPDLHVARMMSSRELAEVVNAHHDKVK